MHVKRQIDYRQSTVAGQFAVGSENLKANQAECVGEIVLTVRKVIFSCCVERVASSVLTAERAASRDSCFDFYTGGAWFIFRPGPRPFHLLICYITRFLHTDNTAASHVVMIAFSHVLSS